MAQRANYRAYPTFSNYCAHPKRTLYFENAERKFEKRKKALRKERRTRKGYLSIGIVLVSSTTTPLLLWFLIIEA